MREVTLDQFEDERTDVDSPLWLDRELSYRSPQLADRLGPYRLVALLGEGGVGRVFLGEHDQLGRRVAIKVLRSRFAENPIVRRRFFQEARAVNQIRHENIIEITDFVESEHHLSYIVMGLVEGRTLAKALRGPLPLPLLISIASQIAEALAAVHDTGIIHRDLKPENIMLTSRGGREDFVTLLDFGTAKLSDEVAGGKSIDTVQGTLIGTPDYMSPEQALAKPIDARADIYSLGVLLYEMLTGKKPFEAPTVIEKLAKQIREQPIRPSLVDPSIVVPPALDDLILRCMAKDPNRRPRDMRTVRAELTRLGLAHTADTDVDQAFSTLLPEKTDVIPPRASSHRRIIAAALLLLSAAALGLTVRIGREEDIATVHRPLSPPTPAKVRAQVEEPVQSKEVSPPVVEAPTSEKTRTVPQPKKKNRKAKKTRPPPTLRREPLDESMVFNPFE